MRDRDARIGSFNSNIPAQSQLQQISNFEYDHRRVPSDPAVAGSNDTIVAGENRDLAVRLAHDEIRRRATARKATRQAGISEEEEQERRTAGVWGNWEEAFTKGDQSIDHDTLSRQMQNVRLQVNGSTNGRDRSPQNSMIRQQATYKYPPIPTARDSVVLPNPSSSDDWGRSHTNEPELPPKQLVPPSRARPIPPQRPAKEVVPDQSPSEREGPAHASMKSSAFTFKPSAYLENGTPLRTIWLPPDLRHRFLTLALPNTRANLETCGILCGTLFSNALFIS